MALARPGVRAGHLAKLIWGESWALTDGGRLTIYEVNGPLVLALGDAVKIWPDQRLTRAA